MNTFHNFSPCVYTTQGKVVCQKQNGDTKLPYLLEGFVNTNPNESEGDCQALTKRLVPIAVDYGCSTTTDTQNPQKCSFRFDCEERSKK
jgi:hypothetical protein